MSSPSSTSRGGWESIARGDSTCDDFYALAEVLRRRVPRFDIALSKAIGRHEPRRFRLAAVDCLGKYVLRQASG